MSPQVNLNKKNLIAPVALISTGLFGITARKRSNSDTVAISQTSRERSKSEGDIPSTDSSEMTTLEKIKKWYNNICSILNKKLQGSNGKAKKSSIEQGSHSRTEQPSSNIVKKSSIEPPKKDIAEQSSPDIKKKS